MIAWGSWQHHRPAGATAGARAGVPLVSESRDRKSSSLKHFDHMPHTGRAGEK